MDAAAAQEILPIYPRSLTPLSFPIWAEQLRATTLSSEKWADMVRRMMLKLEQAASRSNRRRPSAAKEEPRDRVSVGR